MKKRFILLDTFQDFLDYWSYACSRSEEEQIRLWQTSYMNKYPELLDEQIQCYKADNLNWQDIAKQVFPTLPGRLPRMKKARANILTSYDLTCSKASEKLGIDFSIILVVYVGIGCGAGWATRYEGLPAILLGLENIAEEKWHTNIKLHGLISHELGHLAHMNWSNERESFEKKEPDPLFQIYSEGFAQKCEQLITGNPTWHMAPDKDWLSWCEKNRSWLAKEFLRRVNMNMPTKDFFGSWFDIQGKKQTGYFLGRAFISELENVYSLREIASLKTADVRKLALRYLETISTD